ncbi:MAG: asparagine--tRNA ligase [Candidatus Woesearchaeota archaeon]
MAFIKIQEAIGKCSGEIAIRGWVYRERKLKDKIFIVLRDSSNILQCIIKKEEVSNEEWDTAEKMLIESSVEIEGSIKEDSRAPTGYEVHVTRLTLIGASDVFPITKDQSKEFLADNRHLWLRSRKMTAVLKIRSTIFGAIHEYFRSNGFYEFQSPIFQSTQCEGGSTLFPVKYFGEKLYLTQTWQLQAEAGIFALENIYCVAPSFRAEKSKTSRHLTEYWHAEMEIVWDGFDKLQDYGEELIKFIVKKVLETNIGELEVLKRDVEKLKITLEKPFPRMTYTEALDILKEKCSMDVVWGKDLRTIEEDKIMEHYDTPIIVTNYPKEVKAFYMREDPEDPKVVLGYDMLAPEGYGEIIGASEREPDMENIKARLREQGEDPKNYGFYLDTRKYGSVPHAGFGMGVERVVSWICGLDNIKDAIAFPRTMTRYYP